MYSKDGKNLLSIEIMAFSPEERHEFLEAIQQELEEFSVTGDKRNDGTLSYYYVIKRIDGQPISIQEYLKVYEIYLAKLKTELARHINPGYGHEDFHKTLMNFHQEKPKSDSRDEMEI